MNDELKEKRLNDDDLEGVNGGFGKDDNENVCTPGICSHCGSLLKKNGVYYRCIYCRIIFDKYGNKIGLEKI